MPCSRCGSESSAGCPHPPSHCALRLYGPQSSTITPSSNVGGKPSSGGGQDFTAAMGDAMGAPFQAVAEALKKHAEDSTAEIQQDTSYLNSLNDDNFFKEIEGRKRKEIQDAENSAAATAAFGKFLAGGAVVAAIVALPAIGFNVVKNAWTEYQQEKYPDIAIAVTNDKRIFFGTGKTTAAAQKAALETCKNGIPVGINCYPMEKSFKTDGPGYVAVTRTLVPTLPFKNAPAPPYLATLWSGAVGEDEITKLRQSCVIGQINGRGPCPIGPVEYFANTANMKKQVDSLSAHLAEEEAFVRSVLSSAPPPEPVAPATGTPQQVPASPSAPARVTFAPPSYSFDKQLEHYGFTGNGQQPVYEGRIALNAGSLLANVGGEPNDKGVRSLRDIKHGECVLTVNFGKSVLNHWPVYVQSAPQSLTGGWYQGNFGAKCDL